MTLADPAKHGVMHPADQAAQEFRALRKRIAELEAALREIMELPDVDADQRSVIARAALHKSNG